MFFRGPSLLIAFLVIFMSPQFGSARALGASATVPCGAAAPDLVVDNGDVDLFLTLHLSSCTSTSDISYLVAEVKDAKRNSQENVQLQIPDLPDTRPVFDLTRTSNGNPASGLAGSYVKDIKSLSIVAVYAVGTNGVAFQIFPASGTGGATPAPTTAPTPGRLAPMCGKVPSN
jgi:hypothetical protein